MSSETGLFRRPNRTPQRFAMGQPLFGANMYRRLQPRFTELYDLSLRLYLESLFTPGLMRLYHAVNQQHVLTSRYGFWRQSTFS